MTNIIFDKDHVYDHTHTHTHVCAHANDYWTNHSSLLNDNTKLLWHVFMAFIHEITHIRHGKSLLICGCQKHNQINSKTNDTIFSKMKVGSQWREKSSTKVTLFLNEILPPLFSIQPLHYYHHHHQLNHSTNYYNQDSSFRQFPPHPLAETNES